MSTNPRTACGGFSFAEGAGKNLFCKTRNPGHSAIFTKFNENCSLIHSFLLAVIAHRPSVCLRMASWAVVRIMVTSGLLMCPGCLLVSEADAAFSVGYSGHKGIYP